MKGDAMSAWKKQLKKQVEKLGENKASWYVEWNEPDGTRRIKSCGPGTKGKKAADRLCERIKAELLTGTYDVTRRRRKPWDEFVDEYLEHMRSDRKPKTVIEARNSLNHFARILKLKGKSFSGLTTKNVDTFRTVRRRDPGKKPRSTASPSSINKDLRMVKAALRNAYKWGYLKAVPEFEFERESKKLPQYVTPDHFAAMYASCDVATMPGEGHYQPAEWWRGLLVMAQLTGWRIGEILSLEWPDVDLAAGTAITRADDNKGSRDEVVALHPVVVSHLEPLQTFHPLVFPWENHRRTLDVEYARIQDAAEIHLPCNIDRPHDCTPACHRYGFHDERRAFATMNAPNMTREALQALMRHQSPITTARYINIAQQLNPAVANLHVPEFLKVGG